MTEKKTCLENILNNLARRIPKLDSDLLRAGLITSGLFLSGCVATENPVISQPRIIAPNDLNKENLDQLLKSVYKIKVQSTVKETFLDLRANVLGSIDSQKVSYGSCFAFGKDQGRNMIYFATAEHCLPDREITEEKLYIGGLVRGVKEVSKVKIYIVSGNGEEMVLGELSEVARDDSSDLAILRGNEKNSFFYYSKFIDPLQSFPGQEVYSVGFPHNTQNWEKQLTKGIITNVNPASKISGGNKIMMTEAVLDYGMSGGPSFIIHDGNPEILGVNSKIYTNLKNKFGISSGLVELIEKEKLSYLIEIHRSEVKK